MRATCCAHLGRGAVMPKGVGPVFAGLVVVPRWPSTDGGYSPYLSWQGAEESICTSKSVTSRYDDSDAKLTKAGQTDTAGLRLIASRAKTGAFAGETLFNSDIAFENGYAYQGDYQGVSIRDVRDPSNPTLVIQIVCPGSQNDVTINDGILITSTDSRRTNDGCNSTSTSTPTSPTTWEGLKVWDVRDPKAPALLKSVRTDCGSHTHTVLPEANRLLVYVQSYDVSGGNYRCGTQDGIYSHDKISIVEVPKADPAAAQVIATP